MRIEMGIEMGIEWRIEGVRVGVGGEGAGREGGEPLKVNDEYSTGELEHGH